ncbi:hypothetical protein F3Y22_tig00113726pilonHSYRG00190 [Hibiscus syriacus]|uniref:Protein arginine methyltransferase NDUFAF7 n=1 Tax=Hibiscus syriacus TaxID=106335 RepID=A0A6A2XXX9_HIBSY|nr:hypothetical protein F3Y22_tig00113726pilonHSYRG00190 [Hibiscus syriacus]
MGELVKGDEHSHGPSSDSELVKHLKGIIKFRGGPISVAEYMEEVLTNPKAGFYINRDVFGAEGAIVAVTGAIVSVAGNSNDDAIAILWALSRFRTVI